MVSVNVVSKDYAEQKATWTKIRALMAGEDEARDLVLRLPGHDSDTFKAFKARAAYLPVMERTVSMFEGLLFFRDPVVTVPTALDAYVSDIDLEGLSAIRLAAQVANEVLQVGRYAVLIDHPESPEGLSVAQAEAQGLRAIARGYKTEDILFTSFARIGGARKLSQVRVREIRETKDPTDEFKIKCDEIVRVLELTPEGVYQQRVFSKVKGGGWAQEGGPIVPKRKGGSLDYIPIFFFSHRDHEPTAKRPALAGLADVSVAHLNGSALYEWGLMWTANPTPCFMGIAPPPVDERGNAAPGSKQAIRLGSSEGIVLPIGGDAKFLEFTGKGLEEIRESMKHKEAHMARIGARALAEDPRQAVAAETARIQRSSDHSLLGGIAANVSEGMTNILAELALWAGVELADGDGLQLNRNFMPVDMDAPMLTALVSAYVQGTISSVDLFARLQAAEIIQPGKTKSEHDQEVEDDSSKIAALDAKTTPITTPAAA